MFVKRISIIFLLFISVKLCPHDLEFNQETAQLFLKSFINHYEFNPEGRYTHEYHPFLLKWTRKSLHQLEDRLSREGLDLKGRITLMGYEEQAVPEYYTCYNKPKINDEATRKSYAGWSMRLHNRFGFMTGFLFKDLNEISHNYWKNKESVFQHIDADMIHIFDSRAYIFQEHAFGQALPLISYAREQLINKLIAGKEKTILENLVHFWQTLYKKGFTTGNKQVAGTQDVFFSIEYAKYLSQSRLPLFKFFIGPDITYPIEVTSKQHKLATLHAQNFVKQFVPKLQAIEDENTAYVFCSFVDGVGKSTMLGNIKNWMKHGNKVDDFSHVDNSSSQLSEVFKFKDKVFIADLPAQVSHFTYKPDGDVYVDVRAQGEHGLLEKLEPYVLENKALFIKEYENLALIVAGLLKKEGYESSALNTIEMPHYAFMKNVYLLKKDETNVWIPFKYEGKHYLFKNSDPLEIRMLVSIGVVKSEGLKNIESEQMLFFEGVRLPLSYPHFLDDFVDKLKKSGVKKLVFVDFLSMYPRSSRENIRINYLLQQMALLDDKFTPKYSMYKDFVSGGELLQSLLSETSSGHIKVSLALESILRLVLFKSIIQRQEGDLTGFDLASLTKKFKNEIKHFDHDYYGFAKQLVFKKVAYETENLYQLYGQSKSFVNIQQLSFEKISYLSHLFQRLFAADFNHKMFKRTWRNCGIPEHAITSNTEAEKLNEVIQTDRDDQVRGYFAFHPECKNELVLAPFLRSLRANWYAAFCNILQANQNLTLKKEKFPLVPLQIVQGYDDYYYVIQPYEKLWDQQLPANAQKLFAPFNLIKNVPASYVTIGKIPYRIDWSSKQTNTGLFGFGYCPAGSKSKKKKRKEDNIVSSIVDAYQQEHGVETVMPTSVLWEQLSHNPDWHDEQHRFKRDAIKHQQEKSKKSQQKDSEKIGSKDSKKKKQQIRFATVDEFVASRLFVRLLATLEMFVKDPEAHIVVRDGNRDDFKAALKILEKVVLPHFAGIFFSQNLFDDYDEVEPYPSWEFWEE